MTVKKKTRPKYSLTFRKSAAERYWLTGKSVAALAEELKKLEPCGIGNSRPLLLARKVEVAADPKRVGVNAQHLKLWLRQGGIPVDAIAFGKGAIPVRKGQQLDVAFELECNEYQRQRKIQMNIREMAQAE